MISNIEDLSHWLIALMNNGKYQNNQVIPEDVVQATLEPTLPYPNKLQGKGYHELSNSYYGMGRITTSYRGHFMTYHGGALPGFYSQISTMPNDSIGVIVFIIGDQGDPLTNVITYNIYERFTGCDLTPWSEREFKDAKEAKINNKNGRIKSGIGRVPGTRPSHPLEDYVGQYENPAYGMIQISKMDTSLKFYFHHIELPLYHFHYDRFDSPNDEENGLWSLNFTTNPEGLIDGLYLSLDENQATFVRKIDTSLTNPNILLTYTGKYVYAGTVFKIEMADKSLILDLPGKPHYQLLPEKQHVFKVKEFPDLTIEFELYNGEVVALIQTDPSGVYRSEKQK